MTFRSLLLLATIASTAWGQNAPQDVQEGGNLLGWLLLLGPLILIWMRFVFFVIRVRRGYGKMAKRSLQLAEENNELARQQVALQAETNRLLEPLIAERGQK
jgi:hypothetical protein